MTRLPRRLRHRAAADNTDRHMPRAEPWPCSCSHEWVWHIGLDRRCEIAGCGCREFRAVQR